MIFDTDLKGKKQTNYLPEKKRDWSAVMLEKDAQNLVPYGIWLVVGGA